MLACGALGSQANTHQQMSLRSDPGRTGVHHPHFADRPLADRFDRLARSRIGGAYILPEWKHWSCSSPIPFSLDVTPVPGRERDPNIIDRVIGLLRDGRHLRIGA